VNVEPSEREALAAQALALAGELPPGETRSAYRELASAAERGEVPDDWDERAGEVAALALETGRARAEHGAAGVQGLLAVWRRSPQGRVAAERAEDLTIALSALRDLPLSAIRVRASGPGRSDLTIAAGNHEMRVTMDRHGARLLSVSVGAGSSGTGE
jgi:hypothetical protein